MNGGLCRLAFCGSGSKGVPFKPGRDALEVASTKGTGSMTRLADGGSAGWPVLAALQGGAGCLGRQGGGGGWPSMLGSTALALATARGGGGGGCAAAQGTGMGGGGGCALPLPGLLPGLRSRGLLLGVDGGAGSGSSKGKKYMCYK